MWEHAIWGLILVVVYGVGCLGKDLIMSDRQAVGTTPARARLSSAPSGSPLVRAMSDHGKAIRAAQPMVQELIDGDFLWWEDGAAQKRALRWLDDFSEEESDESTLFVDVAAILRDALVMYRRFDISKLPQNLSSRIQVWLAVYSPEEDR